MRCIVRCCTTKGSGGGAGDPERRGRRPRAGPHVGGRSGAAPRGCNTPQQVADTWHGWAGSCGARKGSGGAGGRRGGPREEGQAAPGRTPRWGPIRGRPHASTSCGYVARRVSLCRLRCDCGCWRECPWRDHVAAGILLAMLYRHTEHQCAQHRKASCARVRRLQ